MDGQMDGWKILISRMECGFVAFTFSAGRRGTHQRLADASALQEPASDP